MNSTPIEFQIQALIDSGARGVMVAPSYDGQGLSAKAVTQGQSILNLTTELKDHLTASPRSTEWIADLRDFLDQWLAARSDAARTGGVAIPGAKAHYVLHVQAPTLDA